MKRYQKHTTLPTENPNRFFESASAKDHTKKRMERNKISLDRMMLKKKGDEILLDRMMLKKKMEENYLGLHSTNKVRQQLQLARALLTAPRK